MTHSEPSRPHAHGLAALEDQLARDLDILAFPFKPWMPSVQDVSGHRAFDVVIVGGGQAGISIAVGLMRENVRNILVIDEAEQGHEGPWMTFARMPTLRSPKYLTGPDWGIPSLTFRAWYQAQWGEDAWEGLDKIPNPQWQDYLGWVRKVMRIPMQNNCRLTALAPSGDGYALTVEDQNGSENVRARKVVLCTGIEGGGEWHVPTVVQDRLPFHSYAHASTRDIDFRSLAGKRVAVLGAGASAFDQAATALEAGAETVHLFTRRPSLHRVQTYKHLEQAGFLRSFHEMPDIWRWRFMSHILTLREPPPRETVARVTRHANFTLVTGAPFESLSHADAVITIDTPKGSFDADFLICGTGFKVDLARRPELAAVYSEIALWSDRFSPPTDEINGDLAQYPYLGPGFEFLEKTQGKAPYLRNLHLFTFASTLSHGFSGGGMNGLRYALPRLLDGLIAGLYQDDIAAHFDALKKYDTPEFDLASIQTI